MCEVYCPLVKCVALLTWDICLHGKGKGNDRALRASPGRQKGFGDSQVEIKSGKGWPRSNINLLTVYA